MRSAEGVLGAEAVIAPPRLTHSRVLTIALPIVLSNASVPILGAVDTGVVGQLGLAAPIGAVGIGAIILTAVYWIFGFLRMGTTGLAAQALGARNGDELDALLSRAILIGLSAGFALIVLQPLVFWAGFAAAPASDEVETLARAYMEIRIFSAPAMIAIYGLTGWLIAQERTAAVLVVQLGMNILNIGLSFLFVIGFDWGVEGVALGSLIAEWTGFVIALWFCRAALRKPASRNVALIFDRARLVTMANVNTDILLRSMLLQVAFVSFLFLGSDLGDVPLAANQILLQFLYITAYAMDGLAFAVETLGGQAFGARDRMRVRRAMVLCSLWAVVVLVALALVFALFGPALIDIMATAPAVREEARQYLWWMVAAPILGGASWMLDGIFIGTTRTRDMRNMMAVSLVIYGLSLWVTMGALGNHGLWASLMVFFVARGVTLAFRYPALERAAEDARPA